MDSIRSRIVSSSPTGVFVCKGPSKSYAVLFDLFVDGLDFWTAYFWILRHVSMICQSLAYPRDFSRRKINVRRMKSKRQEHCCRWGKTHASQLPFDLREFSTPRLLDAWSRLARAFSSGQASNSNNRAPPGNTQHNTPAGSTGTWNTNGGGSNLMLGCSFENQVRPAEPASPLCASSVVYTEIPDYRARLGHTGHADWVLGLALPSDVPAVARQPTTSQLCFLLARFPNLLLLLFLALHLVSCYYFFRVPVYTLQGVKSQPPSHPAILKRCCSSSSFVCLTWRVSSFSSRTFGTFTFSVITFFFYFSFCFDFNGFFILKKKLKGSLSVGCYRVIICEKILIVLENLKSWFWNLLWICLVVCKYFFVWVPLALFAPRRR